MGVQIASRLMTRVGATFMRSARILAAAAFKARIRLKHQIINGFILRATGNRNVYIATVMDIPGYIFFGGSTALPVAIFPGLAVPVGIRDDFDLIGTEATFQVQDKSSYYLIPVPTRRRAATQASATDWFPLVQQQDWFLGYSRMDVPVLRDFPDRNDWYLDDETYFDYSTIVALTGAITSLFTSARALNITDEGVSVGDVTPSYFLRNQYAIDESDLPGEWKLYPRRLVPVVESHPDFKDRRYPGITMSGFAIRPISAASALEGIDLYCHAARTFRQYQNPWGAGDEKGYDRDGEQGLLVAVGAQDRSSYDPGTGTPVFASTQSMQVLLPSDIEQAYLHPSPEILPGDESGKPDLPNFGTFYTPTPVQCGDSFAVFSAYTTFRNLGEGQDNPQSGDAWSLLTTLPGGRTVSLRADWNASGGEIETGIPGEFMRPWIVGGAHIPSEEDGPTAYCLAWEQTYQRASITPIKGEWALYSTSGGTPIRTVITGGAPLFALLMMGGPTLFDVSTYDVSNPMSAAYYAGDNKLVTASTDYPPAASNRSIKSAVFDVTTGTVAIGGEIAVSNNLMDKCFITVVQPFIAAKDDREAVPAVLLSTITQHLVDNDGAGKTYISNDGGANWREYIADAGGQGGAFYAGNKLWKFDINRGLDGRSRA